MRAEGFNIVEVYDNRLPLTEKRCREENAAKIEEQKKNWHLWKQDGISNMPRRNSILWKRDLPLRDLLLEYEMNSKDSYMNGRSHRRLPEGCLFVNIHEPQFCNLIDLFDGKNR